LRRDPTDAERKLWLRLRRLPVGDSHFRRQATIGPYFADFRMSREALAIELDGGQHGEELHVVRDEARRLHAKPWLPDLRFWNNDVMQNY